jgi:transposase
VEGEKAEFAEFGYSRDRRPDRMQINFGISTGMNGIPTALTIQKGNIQDRKHFKLMLGLCSKTLPENSLLIFDCGANTRKNEQKIREHTYHFLTLKAKHRKTYKSYVSNFQREVKRGNTTWFKLNDREYTRVKVREKDESMAYVFFSPELWKTQLLSKQRTFEKKKAKGEKILRRRKAKKLPSERGWVELAPRLQYILAEIDNPYVTGIEGFFILECSLDEDPEKILGIYRQRDKAEKFFEALKNGIELRPIRHWNKFSIYGIFFLSFLAQVLINLTLFLNQNSPVKQSKLLKKIMTNLTLTVVHPPGGLRFHLLSNVSNQILGIFGDFVWKFEDKGLNLRW